MLIPGVAFISFPVPRAAVFVAGKLLSSTDSATLIALVLIAVPCVVLSLPDAVVLLSLPDDVVLCAGERLLQAGCTAKATEKGRGVSDTTMTPQRSSS